MHPVPHEESNGAESFVVEASKVSLRTSNPIRQIVDRVKLTPPEGKSVISLSIGDPTLFGNFAVPDNLTGSIMQLVQGHKSDGYAPAVGYQDVRQSIARFYSRPNAPLTENDVVVTCGCSGAIDMAVAVLANEGDNVLIPRPGFSIYTTVAESRGIECRYYDLLPQNQWQVDLNHVRQLVDTRTRAIIINNPSNPCGSVYSREHIEGIIQVIESCRIPVIADEIYGDMTFTGQTFHPFASVAGTRIPVLTCGGMAKRWLVPGWRVGWILLHDVVTQGDKIVSGTRLNNIREGLMRLASIILGANTLAQRSVIAALQETPNSFYEKTVQQLESNAQLCANMLSRIPGLSVITPQGAMYMMIGIDTKVLPFKDDVDFMSQLAAEEAVQVLPGQCFRMPNYFRIVFTSPSAILQEAIQRIAAFCKRHAK